MNYPDGATPLTLDEMNGLRLKHITTREQLDHVEQANIEAGLLWLKRKKKIDLLSEQSVREIHVKLFGEVWRWAGTFRLTEKNIGIHPLQISVQLRLLLDDVRFWIEHKTYSPIEISIRFHHKLVFIHPFPNGNGRHARIMADALLVKRFSLNEINWSRGADLQSIGDRRRQYITALKLADHGDYSHLINFTLN